MRSYVTFFSLRIAIREGAAILAGYAVGFHDYFSFFIRITAYGEAWVSRGLMVESHNWNLEGCEFESQSGRDFRWGE